MEGKRWLEKAFKNQALLINNQKETDQIQLKTITYQLTISQTRQPIRKLTDKNNTVERCTGIAEVMGSNPEWA